MSSIEFVQSSKSKTILVVDGYEYYKKRENKLSTARNCAQYQTLSCRTSAITSGEQLISIRGNHNHDICLGKVGATKVSNKIKELSEVSTPAVSVASALLEVTDEYARQLTLPSKTCPFKVSQRVRQKKDLIHFPDPAIRNCDVPEQRTEGEGEKRNWTSSGCKYNCLPQSDGFLVNVKLKIMNKLL